MYLNTCLILLSSIESRQLTQLMPGAEVAGLRASSWWISGAWSSSAGEAELDHDEGTEVQEDWYSLAAVAEVIVFLE